MDEIKKRVYPLVKTLTINYQMEDILVKDCTPNMDKSPEENSWSVLEQIAREGARRLLQQALEKEVEEYLELHMSFRNEEDRQAVVRNGYMP